MTAQDIFKAIISDDNITLVESVNTILYEKSNMLLEDMRISVGQSIISEAGEDEIPHMSDPDSSQANRLVFPHSFAALNKKYKDLPPRVRMAKLNIHFRKNKEFSNDHMKLHTTKDGVSLGRPISHAMGGIDKK